MKKIMIITLIIISIFMVIGRSKVSATIIPDEAIRLRVIANSNSSEDQNTKMIVKEKLEKNIYNMLGNNTSLSQARGILKKNISKLSKVVENMIINEKYYNNYRINYGLNYFPEKDYKGVTYEEGNYESLVVTLGEGKGDNWWCVLFPPLCLLEAEESTQTEYTFFVQELIDKYF